MKRFGLVILPILAQAFLFMLPVQATHKEINGCGDDSGLGKFVPNQPVGVDFRPVCDNHDECYGTLGESREQCDNRFRSALRAKCEKTLLRSAGGIFGTVVTGGQALTSCYGVSEVYYRSVRERGGTAYSKAQTHAREERSLLATKPSETIGIRRVFIKSAHGNYFLNHTIGNRSLSLADQPYDPATGAYDGELWEIVDAGGGRVFIKSAHGNYFLNHTIGNRSLSLADQPYDPATGAYDGELWKIVGRSSRGLRQ
jgi:hypothetical protein